ncbi:hypothetical protein KCU95_g12415, partial [Aureobasidium melanogenum]
MSSDSSVTGRAESDEPVAKRQKTFNYGPDIVFLQANDKNGVLNTVAHVPGVRYREVCNTIGSDFWPTTTKCIDGVKIEQVKLLQDESVVQFYAHWINERDVEAALELLIDALYCSVEATEQEGLIGTIFTRDTQLRNLLATLYIHHRKEELVSKNRISMAERRLLNLKDDIRVVAVSLLLEAATKGDFSELPKDVLASDFDQHCRYHVHGDKGRCYRQKQS